ncbi:nucleoside hydrolase [Pseudonocardia sp. WMMC193]|uniref:nucleoside hydrolase n=1 Tax=Pseudonocardia sp. WMMC193 TaxID=2911965 RepID=UPI001F37786A|nr:nucleoside hydrolase [Pseudonocardia sp. WMMC193]MCF7549948.1 nucleoside hydrolase [Pseudonocardia sp. WMMC193]
MSVPVVPVLLDCDPGHDDAFALFVALGHPGLDLVGVTTVCGNQTVERVTANAAKLLDHLGVEGALPLARGAERPLARDHRAAPDIHGESGMDGPVLPASSRALDPRPADELIVDLVRARPGTVLVATGPLTNLALALRRDPEIARLVGGVAIMGGAVTTGNVTASAEFNIYVDPEAAAEVFAAPWTVTMMGLEVTHQALATPDVRARLAALGGRAAVLGGELLDFFGARYLQHQGFAAPPVHDLCPMVHLVAPEVFTTVEAPVAVEVAGALTLGRTVVDLRDSPPGPRHVVGLSMDAERFWDVVLEAVARLP